MTINKIPKDKGIYVIFMYISRDLNLRIGSLGAAVIQKGYYIYIGSAKGPGGLRARIERHLRKQKRIHWHIDYLTSTSECNIYAIVYALTNKDLESVLSAKLLKEKKCFNPTIRGFGCSDKTSYTHLFKCNCVPIECISRLVNIIKDLSINPQVILLNSIHNIK